VRFEFGRRLGEQKCKYRLLISFLFILKLYSQLF